MNDASLANLDGLLALSRRDGFDVRPALLRVLTDLFVQQPTHTRQEEQHYVELALRLMDAVDLGTKAAVARKLSAYPSTPDALRRKLGLEIGARPQPNADAELDAAEACLVAAMVEPAGASDIVSRYDLRSRTSIDFEALHNEEPDEELGSILLRVEPLELRQILTYVLASQPHASEPTTPEPNSAAALLERAALDRIPDDFARGLERSLRLAPDLCARIVADNSGELLVLACKAVGLSPAQASRVLLLLNPAIGRSVERVFALSDLYRSLERATALTIAETWRALHPASRQTGVHAPLLYDDERRPVRHPGAEALRGAGRNAGADTGRQSRRQRTT